jgi:hypothetical protein
MILDWLFSFENKRPKWRINFEERLYEIVLRTGMSRDQLLLVANVLEEMNVIPVVKE